MSEKSSITVLKTLVVFEVFCHTGTRGEKNRGEKTI